MKIIKITFCHLFLISGILTSNSQSLTPAVQTSVNENQIVAQPIPDRSVLFNLSDEGVSKPILWGLDTAWPNEANIRRGVAFMGAENVDVVRVSFQPTLPLVNGDLQQDQINWVNTRLSLVNYTGAKTRVVLNSDHPSVDPWYVGNALRWAQLMDATAKRFQDGGRKIISISPFNEPDYTATGQGTITDFYNIAGELRKMPRFDTIRISGGNTLNCDQALPWYNTLKDRLEEGNTHQLAGSFDNYANFYQNVRANGDYATNDELHNVMEAMVGVEYGLQTGIWWGTAELARGEFVKASKGKRLGYAEHRPNWTAASVYRGPGGKVQAFGGTSERQAATTTYRFVSKDRDVFFDGYGPQREYTMVLPGGTGYQVGQTNAERVVNITWGDDIQPVINGKYVLVNRNSAKVMEVASGALTRGANIRQGNPTGVTYQQWNVTPVDSRIGGDFSYFTLTAVHSGKAPDVLNYSLDNGGNILVWDDVKGANQQWYFEYAEDGWFYIRNRHSNKCIEVANNSILNAANIQQWDKDGGTNQQWRLLPVDAAIEFIAPAPPADLTAKSNSGSVELNWTSNQETDLAGYNVYRSETQGGNYNTIARNITTNSFVDNNLDDKTYYYAIKAVDKSLNRSAYSNEISASVNGNKDLMTKLNFSDNLLDSTINLNHSSSYGTISYTTGKVGTKAVSLNGTNAYLQLPVQISHQKEMTIASWVYVRGLNPWQRIFDFGNSDSENMFLTPRNNAAKLRFGIKNGGTEQILEAPALTYYKWTHVAITLGTKKVSLYLNGVLANESEAITIRPADFKPVLNYIGRSQYNDPLFNGNIDDFRIYNYALTPSEVADLAGVISENEEIQENKEKNIAIWPVPAKEFIQVNYASEYLNNHTVLSIYNLQGSLIMSKVIQEEAQTKLDISHLPTGIYTLQITNDKETLMKKFTIHQ